MTGSRDNRLTVLVDARIRTGVAGGVEQFLLGLASGFRAITTDTRILFLVYEGETEWLEPHLGGPCSLVTAPSPPPPPRWRKRAKTALPILGTARDALLTRRTRRADPNAEQKLPPAPAVVSRHEPDVIHFAKQKGFRTTTPSIYHPWDTQHLHLPGFFSVHERIQRDRIYSAMARQAVTVCVPTEWGKQDVVAHLGLPEAKVLVIPLGAPTAAYDEPSSTDVARVRDELRLPETFAFYPAQTWPHKNHARLFGALASLRDRGLRVPLVCSGYRNEFFPEVERQARAARVEDQVTFVGFVSPMQLQALYALARVLVFPSLFEGWGFPVTEALRADLPVACSNATSLPEHVGDAAVMFDPTDVEAIAQALEQVWSDEQVRRTLVDAGRRRVAELSWARTASAFCLHYHALAAEDGLRRRQRHA